MAEVPMPSESRDLRRVVSDVGLPDFCRVLLGALQAVKHMS